MQVKGLGIAVVLSSLPKNGGHGSLNYQRKSSLAGIRKAIGDGAEFILKIRTDQRMYSNGNLSFFLNLILDYPIKNDIAKGRLIITSLGTFSNRLYSFSDMVVFGYAEDILRYFNYPEDLRTSEDIVQDEDLIEYSKKKPGEIYIVTSYLEKLGWNLEWTVKDSLNAMIRFFLVIDCESLDLFWPKYTNQEYRWRAYNNVVLRQVTFKDWLNLYDTYRGSIR
jgi:hypothetical protein